MNKGFVSNRKLLKLKSLSKRMREYLQEELESEKYYRKYKTDCCPICGGNLYKNSWSEDHWGIVETIVRCGWRYSDNPHYLDHTSYGYTDLIAGRHSFSYNYNTPWKEIDSIRADWMLAASKVKEEQKKIRALSYRKTKSQGRRVRG